MGAELDDNLRAVRVDGKFKFIRPLGDVLPLTEVRRLEAYVAWYNESSPGDVGPIESLGINNAVQSDRTSFDPDNNLDRLLIKVRVPTTLAVVGENVTIEITVDDVPFKSKDIPLIEDPWDDAYLITEKPILLYDDPNSELDVGSLSQLLPEETIPLDPPVQNTNITVIRIATQQPLTAGTPGAYALHSVSQLYSHTPLTNPATFTSLAAGAITSPGPNDNYRLAYQLNAQDADANIQMRAVDVAQNVPAPTSATWYINIRFRAGDDDPRVSGRIFRIQTQWHPLQTVPPNLLNFNIVTFLSQPQADQLSNELGPGDYEIYLRTQVGQGANVRVFESNHVRFKIVGTNPGQAPITQLVDTFTIPIGGVVTQVIADRLRAPMRAWYKSILSRESAAGAYTGRQNWDHFERNPETAGIDEGFQREIRPNFRWLARYGWPFVVDDNGYGISQLTNITPPLQYCNVSRWRNNVYKGWLWLTKTKLQDAITYLGTQAGRALTADDDEFVKRETTRRYNGGHQYLFSNGEFVVDPAVDNYVDLVHAAGVAGGWLQ